MKNKLYLIVAFSFVLFLNACRTAEKVLVKEEIILRCQQKLSITNKNAYSNSTLSLINDFTDFTIYTFGRKQNFDYTPTLVHIVFVDKVKKKVVVVKNNMEIDDNIKVLNKFSRRYKLAQEKEKEAKKIIRNIIELNISNYKIINW